MSDLPRLVVAGTRSGVGKTTVATGLMAALARRGMRVSGHKVGPDFIDPGYHALACGRAPRNLDAYLHGPERIAPLLRYSAAGADIAVIEGVMGLFDGRGSDDEASTAHVARLLDAPVLLVVDAAAASRSLAAEVHGFASFDPTIQVVGVVLNRVASDTHERLVREALAPLGLPVMGVLRKHHALAVPARHLGLVPVAERRAEAQATVSAMAEVVDAQVDLAAVVELARSAPPLPTPAWDPVAQVGPAVPGRPVVAVTGGGAFTFVYEEHRELLAAAGAQVVSFDPLTDPALPAGTRAIYLGGGFPQLYAATLAANTALAAELRSFAATGAPIIAECGGLLYLCRSLDGSPMAGVVEAEARFTERLTLGYRQARSLATGPLGPAGTLVRGHEFHRTTVTPPAGAQPAWRLSGSDGHSRLEGFRSGGVHASYLHAAWVGTPQVARRLVTAAVRHTGVECPA